MNTYTSKLTAAVVSLTLLTFTGCSKKELSYEDIGQNDSIETTAAKTSGGSCSTAVNFNDLQVETTYVTKLTNDKDVYDACGVDDELWMNKYFDNRVKLQCLEGNGHRTELKEATGDEANLTTYKRMKFTGKYTNIPSNGVTIAQIHNRANGIKRPWLRLYIDSDGKFKIKETLTEPWADKSTYTTYTGMEYTSTSNKNVTVRMWTGLNGKEKAKIRVDYNGERFVEYLSPHSDWDDYADHFYLKAGVYTKGTDKQARVTYSTFSIAH